MSRKQRRCKHQNIQTMSDDQGARWRNCGQCEGCQDRDFPGVQYTYPVKPGYCKHPRLDKLPPRYYGHCKHCRLLGPDAWTIAGAKRNMVIQIQRYRNN